MEQKYFTPDITDIRVGYEYEEYDGYGSATKEREPDTEGEVMSYWQKRIIERDDFRSDEIQGSGVEEIFYLIENNKKRIRVPYLTREQIEAEGWVYSHTISGGTPSEENDIFEKEGDNVRYRLDNDANNNIISISGWFYSNIRNPLTKTSFQGSCPSINELRLIQKLLNIK